MSVLADILLARWWWNPNNPAKVLLQPREKAGKVERSHWPADMSADLEPAAFAYEMLARVSWHYALEISPVPYPPPDLYPLGRSFVKLSQQEQLEVHDEMEHRGCVWPTKLPDIFPVADKDLRDEPPMGWMRFAFEFDPAHITAGEVAKRVEEHIKAEAQRQGVALLEGSQRQRNVPWPWKTLEGLDRMLAGEQHTSDYWQSERNLLNRYLDLWPKWYLSQNDLRILSRPDTRGFMLANQNSKQ